MADLKDLTHVYFEEKEARGLFAFAHTYHRKRGRKNLMDIPLARAKLDKSDKPFARKLRGLVDEYDNYDPISDHEFQDAIDDIIKSRKERVLRTHGTKALEFMVEGKYELAEAEIRNAMLGAEDVDIDDDRPADIRSPDEIEDERARIEEGPANDDAAGFNVGFPRLMRAVRFRRQELTIIGGYAADGKTQFSKSLAYHANQNGASVFFCALEMSRQEVRTMFIAQHCAKLDPGGIHWVDALDGRLNAAQKKLWYEALDDFQINEHEDSDEIESVDGASLVIWAPRKRITQGDWRARVRAAKSDSKIDIAVKDYTELVKPEEKKGFANYRLDLKDMVEEDKALARELDIWCIDNHQISRKGRDDAEKRKPGPHYLKRDLGESSGLERAADHILWVYSDGDLKDDREAKIGIAKARKGREIVHGYHVYADFAKSLVTELGDMSHLDED